MEAFVCCKIYGRYKYDNEDCDYQKALKGLNKELKELVKEGKLSILYKGKEVKIKLPLPYYKVGNIFEDEGYWEGIEIPCTFKEDKEKFNSKELRLGTHPVRLVQYGVCW